MIVLLAAVVAVLREFLQPRRELIELWQQWPHSELLQPQHPSQLFQRETRAFRPHSPPR
jgi:hypothetical protein